MKISATQGKETVRDWEKLPTQWLRQNLQPQDVWDCESERCAWQPLGSSQGGKLLVILRKGSCLSLCQAILPPCHLLHLPRLSIYPWRVLKQVSDVGTIIGVQWERAGLRADIGLGEEERSCPGMELKVRSRWPVQKAPPPSPNTSHCHRHLLIL